MATTMFPPFVPPFPPTRKGFHQTKGIPEGCKFIQMIFFRDKLFVLTDSGVFVLDDDAKEFKPLLPVEVND